MAPLHGREGRHIDVCTELRVRVHTYGTEGALHAVRVPCLHPGDILGGLDGSGCTQSHPAYPKGRSTPALSHHYTPTRADISHASCHRLLPKARQERGPQQAVS